MSRSSVSIPLRILRSTYPELADAVVTDPVTGSKSVPLPAIPEEPDVYVAVQVPDFLSAVYGDLVEVVSPYLNEDACEAFANAANEALKLVFIESLANASWPRKTSALPTVAEQDEGVPVAETRTPGSAYLHPL